MAGDETQEPTLRRGTTSADGWIEYAQELLNFHFGEPRLVVDGDFGGNTHQAVVEFQGDNGLQVDGVIGNQTWAALRQETPQEVGTDGRSPGFVDEGFEARWFLEEDSATYFVDADMLVLGAANTGTAAIDAANVQLPAVTLTGGDETHVLEPVRFFHDAGRAEAGDRFLFVCDAVRPQFSVFDPLALDVQAVMSAEFGGDVMSARVTPIGAERPFVANIVTDGARLLCTQGTLESILVVPPRAEPDGFVHETANVLDSRPLINIMPLGMCTSPLNPQVNVETALNGGVLTPVPCVPVTPGPWFPGSFEILVEGQPVLTLGDQCVCAWSATVTILDPGTGVSIQDRP